MQLRKEAKRKPEKIQAYRDSNPDFCKIWVRAREYRKRVIAVVVSFLFHYCNPRSIASLNYNYQWRQFCRREMSRWDIACVVCRPRAPFTFSPPILDYDVFCWIINKRWPIGAHWSKTKKWHSFLLITKFSKQSNKISLCKCRQELVMLKRSKC